MISKIDKNELRSKKHASVRLKVEGTEKRPRLAVFRSLSEIYAQVINDEKGITLVSAGSLEKELAAKIKGKSKTEVAKIVGTELAKRAKSKKINEVVFDRGGYVYTGRVQALADAARDAGLKF